MPHLFMHLRHGDEFVEDLEGADYGCLEDAREDAKWAAREIMSERLRQGRVADGCRFEVMDENGNVVLVYPFSEAIDDSA